MQNIFKGPQKDLLIKKAYSSGQTDWNLRIIGKRDEMKAWKL